MEFGCSNLHTSFKEDFKYFKRKCPMPDYSSVIDFNDNEKKLTCIANLVGPSTPNTHQQRSIGRFLIPPSQWKIYELVNKPGLFFICNPFTSLGQRYWICRCLKDFPCRPHRLNLDAHEDLKVGENWWEKCKSEKDENLRKKLRWVTLGFHHNWDTKVYSDDAWDPVPYDLADLSAYVSEVVGFKTPFQAQAAIINFYHFDSTLSGHTDHSELDMSAPLFSFSFGQTAIFLLGGPSLEDKPTPIYIQSGDILVMSGSTRQCYHGIPKIMPSTFRPYDNLIDSDRSEGNEDFPFSNKQLTDPSFWEPFNMYVEQSRINMNVRQVLPFGQTKISTTSIKTEQ